MYPTQVKKSFLQFSYLVWLNFWIVRSFWSGSIGHPIRRHSPLDFSRIQTPCTRHALPRRNRSGLAAPVDPIRSSETIPIVWPARCSATIHRLSGSLFGATLSSGQGPIRRRLYRLVRVLFGDDLYRLVRSLFGNDSIVCPGLCSETTRSSGPARCLGTTDRVVRLPVWGRSIVWSGSLFGDDSIVWSGSVLIEDNSDKVQPISATT